MAATTSARGSARIITCRERAAENDIISVVNSGVTVEEWVGEIAQHAITQHKGSPPHGLHAGQVTRVQCESVNVTRGRATPSTTCTMGPQ